MSHAVMPLEHYKEMCDKVREKVNLSVAKFEDTDFEFVRSSEFVVEESGTYTFAFEVKDESKLNIYNIYYDLSDWANNSSPGVFEIIDNKTMSAYFYSGRVYRIFIGDYNGLKASDILSATLSYNGEIVENFVETKKIKSGEMPGKIDEVYEAGRKDEQTEFWEIYQDGGKRTSYGDFANDGYFTDENFNPIYPFTCGNTQSLFSNNCRITDTKQPIIATAVNFRYCFNSNQIIKIIRGLDLTVVKDAISLFYNCRNIEECTFLGTIYINGISVATTKLSHDSLMSFINALADYSSDTSGTVWKVSIGANNLAKLTEEEKAIMDSKGWQYS